MNNIPPTTTRYISTRLGHHNSYDTDAKRDQRIKPKGLTECCITGNKRNIPRLRWQHLQCARCWYRTAFRFRSGSIRLDRFRTHRLSCNVLELSDQLSWQFLPEHNSRFPISDCLLCELWFITDIMKSVCDRNGGAGCLTHPLPVGVRRLLLSSQQNKNTCPISLMYSWGGCLDIRSTARCPSINNSSTSCAIPVHRVCQPASQMH